MAKNNKHLKENNKKEKKNKRADINTAPKKKKKEEKFNFDNEIVIGVNVIPQNKKDKPSSNKKNNAVKSSNNKTKKDYKKVNKQKEIKNKENKENTKHTHKKINILKILKYLFLISILVGVIVFIMTTPLFNVTQIIVDGNNIISKERIESLSKISLNVNTYQYSKKEIINNIKEEPYVKEVVVKRKLPNIIDINVQERSREFIISNMGSYIYIDNQGYILEITNEPEKLTEIKGLSTNSDSLIPGNRLCDEDLEKLNTIIEIVESAKNNDMKNYITNINVNDKNDYCIVMSEEMKKIHLGNASNINDRMLMLKEILTKEKGKTGEVFIQDLNKVYFREASWIE